MKVKVWSCRGSIATPGLDTLRYGGNSTCLEIRSAEGQIFIVDAGSGVRNLWKAILHEQDRFGCSLFPDTSPLFFNKDATSLAIDAGVKRFELFHHDPDRTDDDLDRQADYCREQISRAGSSVECFPCAEGMVIAL